MSRVILQGYIVVPESELPVIKAELAIHCELTKQEAGCLVFDVSPCPDSPNIFKVYEEFVDQQAFDLHQTRVKTSEWGKISVNVQRHYKIVTQS